MVREDLVVKEKLEDSTFTIVNIYEPNVDHCSRQFFDKSPGALAKIWTM